MAQDMEQLYRRHYQTVYRYALRLTGSEHAAEELAAETFYRAMVALPDFLRIHRLLHRLPEPYREVFLLRVLGELSFRDIGSLFEKGENWACVTYHRARKKIMEQMEGTP